jgi:hypothetical protein
MFTKILLLLTLSAHAFSGGLRPNPMTTVIPRPRVTVHPADGPLYHSQPQRGSLYYLH